VRVTPVTRKEISQTVHTSGILAPADEIKLSFKTGGIISRINTAEGQKVRQGSLLATLDLSEINSLVSQARNAYDKAIRDFRRAENLYRDSVATLEMKQNASTALEVSKSAMESAEFNLRHSSIYAPSDGIILKQLARPNELIAPGYPVFLFGSSGKNWKLRCYLSDRDIVRIAPGDSARVTFDAYPEKRFNAVVEEIGAMADQYTGTFETELLLDPGNSRLASGFIGSVDIFPSEKKSYAVIPVGALTEADGKSGFVYITGDSAVVRRIRIDIVTLLGDELAVTGIPADVSEVISEGAAYLKDGMRVMVIR
jgi:RND family efflux transporter MFP subunit